MLAQGSLTVLARGPRIGGHRCRGPVRGWQTEALSVRSATLPQLQSIPA